MNDSAIISWLLDEDDPSIRYRVLTELLGRPADDREVLEAQRRIPDSPAVSRILQKMHPDGYWLQRKASTGEMIGAGTEYGSYATTHFCLSYLAELGLDRSHPDVARAAERYLNLQAPDGDFWLHLSCLNGYNLRTFVRLGYGDDHRVRRTLDLMLSTHRGDGGYLCELHDGKYRTRETKSCVRGSGRMVIALVDFPETWNLPRVRRLFDYFLDRELLFRRSDPSRFVHKSIATLQFPFTWSVSSLELLYAFSLMGLGNDPRLERAWSLLESKRLPDGRFPLESTPGQALLKAGRRGEANRWVTLYALMAYAARIVPR